VRPPARFSATPSAAGAPAPGFGQHSDEIATELGRDAAALRAAGVIF
jgi:crotonobetainyl-CoA:carnitine CoA-transferase CaiB-like acyl-CoA transferase